MKPFLHARGSVARWGGKPEDYIAIHDLIDHSKIAMPDMRHRAVLHNAFGCFIVERVFGHTITNSDGRQVSTRDVAEEHIKEDLGFIPSLEDFLADLPMQVWHGGIHRLAKQERPPTPEETREARRERTKETITEHINAGDLLLNKSIDAVIAAVLGIEKDDD